MIRFEDLQRLKTLLELLKVDKATEEFTAVSCLRIQQISSDTTEFTTLEPNSGVYTRYYTQNTVDGWGQEGVVYLVEFAEFYEIVAQLISAQSKTISIQAVRGRLQLQTDYGFDHVLNDYSYKDSRTVRLYPGAVTDFSVPISLLTKTSIGYTIANEFDSFVTALSKFGDFGDRYVANQNHYIRTCLLHFTDSFLTGVCNHKGIAQAHLSTSCALRLDDGIPSFQTAIEGRLLSRLINLGNNLRVYQNEDWLIFHGSNGEVAVKKRPVETPVREVYQRYIEPVINDETAIPSTGIRAVYTPALLNAAKAQILKTNTVTSDIVLIEDDENDRLVVTARDHLETDAEQTNVRLTDVPVVDTNSFDFDFGDFYPTAYTASTLIKCLEAMATIQGLLELEFKLVITQRCISLQNITRWLVYFSIPTHRRTQILFVAKEV